MGYQLTDNSIGVYFNDSTGIVLHPDQLRFTYFEDKIDLEGKTHLVSDYPNELSKKVTLLRYFKSYMQEHLLKDSELSKVEQRVRGVVFLRKWLRTKHAMFFRLSNRVTQVNFFDHTKVILFQGGLSVLFINAQREHTSIFLPTELDSCPEKAELIHRLKYIRDIIDQVLMKRQQSS